MMQNDIKSSPDKLANHMANERTFLAWIRTSIAIMAFGFVIERFSLFIKLLEHPSSKHWVTSSSAIVGVVLVGLGLCLCVFSYIKYNTTKKEIEQQIFSNSVLLDFLLTSSVLLIGLFLIFSLIHNL